MIKEANSIFIRSDLFKSTNREQDKENDFFKISSNTSENILRKKESTKVLNKFRKFQNFSSYSDTDKNESDNDKTSIKIGEEFYEIEKKYFLSLIENDIFEYGYSTNAEKYLQSKLIEEPLKTKEWFNTLFNENFQSSDFMIKILHIMGGIDYELLDPQGTTMAVSATRNRDEEVKESAIRVFENWGSPQALSVLKGIECHEEWLQEYLTDVIVDLEKEQDNHDLLS